MRSTRLGALALFATLGLLAAHATASGAAADNGPHVTDANSGAGGLTADTCAGCHRTHSAQGEYLLAAAGDALCLVCHGAGGQGAATNVSLGVLAGSGASLKGGGFTSAVMDTAWTGGALSQPVTSRHGMAGQGGTGTMWGAGASGAGVGVTGVALECTSCHNPHGNGSWRILRPIPSGAPVEAGPGVTLADEASKVYTVASAQARYFGEIYFKQGNPFGDYTQQLALDQWCATCHSRYDAGAADSADVTSGDPVFMYRHTNRDVYSDVTFESCFNCHKAYGPGKSAPDPMDVSSSITHYPVCENCHVAHGTSAVMGDHSGSIPYPDGSTAGTADERSSLLRIDSRGICWGCHDPTGIGVLP